MTDLLPSGFVFHQSNLQAFQTCRYRFLLRYIKKMPWPAPLTARSSQFEQDQAAGSTLHALIHQYFLGIDPQMLLALASDYPDRRVQTWLGNFLSSPYVKITPNQHPEHSLQIVLSESLLMAKFDLISRDDDHIEICDWKSSRVLPKRLFLQDRIQTIVYPLVAFRAQSQPPSTISMHYWEAEFPDQPIIFEIAQVNLDQAATTLNALITQIRSLEIEQFERTTNHRKCACCEYQSFCARGGSPGDQEDLYNWTDISISELSS